MKLFCRLTVLAATLIAGPALAVEQPNVVVELKAFHVVTQSGKEKLEPAEQIKPGEILEYRATYRNTSHVVAHNVVATLPVPPQGVQYLRSSAQPAGVLVSTNGKDFASPPLQRTVKLADGRQEVQIVPDSEYRFLRWPLGDLPAGGTLTVSARMQLVLGTAPRPAL
jgi:uncharacterized repeat protein (TIGR01451 family)